MMCVEFLVRNKPRKVTVSSPLDFGGFVECFVFFSETNHYDVMACTSIMY